MSTTLLADFETLARPATPGPGWLQRFREAGLERFRAQGYPSPRQEDWRFINLEPVTGRDFRLAPSDVSGVGSEAVAPFRLAIPGVHTLVFVNGRFAPGLSSIGDLPAGVVVRNLAGAVGSHGDLLEKELGRYARAEQNGFVALNAAFAHDGLFVHLARDVELAAPIHALFLTDHRAEGAATFPRNFLRLERGARAGIIESYFGLTEGRYLTNTVTEAVVEEGAALNHIRIQRESELSCHVGTTHLHQGRSSRGETFSVSLGAALCRNNLDVVLDGAGSEAQMLGFYLGRGSQEIDNHTALLHAHPDCASREVYKGILAGRAHGVFNGKIYVTPIAQKTDAKQTNRALLLSDQARVDTKPQLEIFADDVKCTHGATVGNLDHQAGFYLKSRGIGPALADRILTWAFAAEVLEELPYEALRLSVEREVMQRLGSGLA